MENIYKNKWLLICGIIMLAFPFLINLILLIPAFTPVVGDTDAPTVWLQFWGAYISAIGTLCMAFLAYKAMNKDIDKHKYDVAKADYSVFEDRICKYERLHIFEQIETIAYLYLSKGYYDAKVVLNNYKVDLQIVALELVKFNEQSNIAYKNYGSVLRVINQLMFDITFNLEKLIDYCENGIERTTTIKMGEYSFILEQKRMVSDDEKSHKIKQFLDAAYQLYSKPQNVDTTLYRRMASSGQDLLKSKSNYIKELSNNFNLQ